jgi:hypothetical protein
MLMGRMGCVNCSLWCCGLSIDGLKVVGACEDGRVRLWSIKEGSLVGQPWEGNND